MIQPLGVSIIVVNYNHERFLAAAIDSALGQNHPHCEVIAVDDCSTDNSVAVIARYGDRIRSVVRKTNGGQVEALNSAWPLARYPILIFLDSDDLLLAHAAATVAARWTLEIVKVQAPLVTIDQTGREIGRFYPKYPPDVDTARIRAELLRTGGAPNSPASGNAYSRSLLKAVAQDGGFDLDRPRNYWMDTILTCNAPFYGEVISLSEPFACYRIHATNLYRPMVADGAHFTRMLNYFDHEIEYFTGRCRSWGISFDPVAARNHSLWALECGLIADKLACNNSPAVTDSSHHPARILFRALRACMRAPLPMLTRIIRAGWLISVAVTPKSIAIRLVALRFIPSARPAWFAYAHRRLMGPNAGRGGRVPSGRLREGDKCSARSRSSR
jgi:glycosyltransferase involved in cell wall biosynthesis